MPKFDKAADRQFGLVLFLMMLAAFGAEAIHLEPIVWGLHRRHGHRPGDQACQRVRASRVHRPELYSLPVFFISIGFHIDLGVFVGTLVDNVLLVLAVVGGLILAKLAAALITQRLYRFTPLEGLLMWSLSLPQVAATLAAALVAYNTVDQQGQRLIDEPILNTSYRPDGGDLDSRSHPHRAFCHADGSNEGGI